ncbi:unnamed protein product [Thelazia callipaeda]|uniref:BEN domain-containing protein n=1 Tax=Thelazia callipaeda TaxID=103827 RepID=A0A0N5D981_THECL|nr:unnamed protein product [Thelazia callipaeda]
MVVGSAALPTGNNFTAHWNGTTPEYSNVSTTEESRFPAEIENALASCYEKMSCLVKTKYGPLCKPKFEIIISIIKNSTVPDISNAVGEETDSEEVSGSSEEESVPQTQSFTTEANRNKSNESLETISEAVSLSTTTFAKEDNGSNIIQE